MFNLFKKKPKKAKPAPQTKQPDAPVEVAEPEPKTSDIEVLISDIAAHKRDEDYKRFYQLLMAHDLCVPVDLDTLPAGMSSGEKLDVGAPNKVRIRTVRGPRGALLIPSATSSDADMVKDGYVRMASADYLGLVRKVAPAWGAIIQGKSSWIGVDQQRISTILNEHASVSQSTLH
ncbi:MAG: SseB family protein [Pseudomonadota bacterium]